MFVCLLPRHPVKPSDMQENRADTDPALTGWSRGLSILYISGGPQIPYLKY